MPLSLNDPLTLAVPKGRILTELTPLFAQLGITPEPAFYDESSRLLQFATNHPLVRLIRVRSFDVATFVAFGAAQLGVAGSDVLMEFDYSEIYAPLDLNIGHCRISLAGTTAHAKDNLTHHSHLRIATKYPNITKRHFAAKGIQAECIKLSGAIELAPILHLSSHIVDLVSTGSTLKANGLQEVEVIDRVSSRLIVNRTALKTRSQELSSFIQRCRDAVEVPHG